MAALPAVSPALMQFLQKNCPALTSEPSSNHDLQLLSNILFPNISHTTTELAEVSRWLTTSDGLTTPNEETWRLDILNAHLATRTTLLGTKPSLADIGTYHRLGPEVKSWTLEQRTGEHGYHHIVRFVDFIQNSPIFRLSLRLDEKVEIDVDNVKFRPKFTPWADAKVRAKEDKLKKKSTTASANEQTTLSLRAAQKEDNANAGKDREVPHPSEDVANNEPASRDGARPPKKEKKDKQPKPQKQPAKDSPLSPCLIDLRVGHILKAVQHPNADSLYVSTIACGDQPGAENTSEYEGQVVRTVCSGLNGLVPLEEMQGRKIVAVCNLKPVTMRGIKSAAMVLAASPRLAEGEVDNHKGPVELVNPPAEAKTGERLLFDGWAGEPEGVLNPKKKVWETLQPGFTTTESLEVGIDANVVPQLQGDSDSKKEVQRLRTADGAVCSVKSLKGATVR
ncbi:MAG: hypothetical protein LQ351_005641 [Letrouitia transgressa]|nr:MAG: hypothetical protein LQ351_005641 [Letrouitia transgressa]